MDPENNGLSNEDLAAFDAMREADTAIPADPAPAAVDPGAPVDESGNIAPVVADPADPAAPQGDGRQKLVPHAALHEERERRKAIEKAAAEDRQRAEQRMNQMLQLLQQQQAQVAPKAADAAPQPPAIPPIEQDPVGHIVGLLQQTRGDVDAVRRAYAEREQQAQQQTVISAIQQRAAAAESEFRATAPDYDAATTHLITGRHRELELAGFTDPVQRQNLIQQEALGMAARALQMGRNPAEMIYELAKHRGYSAMPAAPAATAAAPAPQAVAPDAAQQIAQIAAGQQQARTLGGASGSAPPAFNANTVLNMDDKAFDKWLASASDEQRRAVFGA